MCGICGIAYRDPRLRPEEPLLRRMSDTLRHRGPDDWGVEVLGSVGLAFRRLSIVDLSRAGHQPMPNEDGSVWIVFNGEIYNFRQLRRQIEARHSFRSRTDSEVLVHLYEERGEQMVEELEGMFAFAIFDVPRRKLILARDPFGIKPLFYAFNGERFVFGSELKPLLASNTVARTIDPAALHDYFDFLWVPAPRSIFSEVRKLLPAHTMTLELDSWETTFRRYWRPEYRPQSQKTIDQWADEVEAELNRSIKAQMVADVPIGAFLSGGIDSSLVCRGAALATQQPVRTFTIDFTDRSCSEGEFARQIATAIKANPVSRRVEAQALAQLPHLVEYYDEPFADSSMLPTFAVSRVTREFVTVALSGDGGDELFSGYHHHYVSYLLSKLDFLPHWLTSLSFGAVARATPSTFRLHQWGRRLSLPPELRRLTTARLPGLEHRAAVLHADYRQNGEARFWHLRQSLGELHGLPPVTQAQMYDLLFYLPNDMLVKVDRASMAHSLEVRVPFLNTSLAQLAFRIPEEVRFQPSTHKRVLRRLVARHFGDELAYRPKMGFGVPLRRWMREFARGGGEAAILSSPAMRSGALDAGGIQRLFHDVGSDYSRWRVDRSEELFALLVFAAWWERFAD